MHATTSTLFDQFLDQFVLFHKIEIVLNSILYPALFLHVHSLKILHVLVMYSRYFLAIIFPYKAVKSYFLILEDEITDASI